MTSIHQSTRQRQLIAFCLTALIAFTGGSASAQEPSKPQADDVLRVNTDLVQTAITVFDKNGRFVDDLDRAQFELTVDGKPRPVSFFERVTAGSAREAELAARNDPAVASTNAPAIPPSVRGRNIVFFIDDLHLSPDSMNRTKQMLRRFLDSEMSSKDSVAIASPSGQIGFLQQYTNNKQVLEAAMARLNPRPYDVRGYGTGSTKMTEYLALSIENSKSDNKVMAFYIGECLRQNLPPKNTPAYQQLVQALKVTCENQVKNSARAVLMQAGSITRTTYVSLESLMRSSARAPGRKLAFFVSDGFLMDTGPQGPNLRDKLDRIIDAATRAGVVVYTIDARGLSAGMVPDAANSRPQVGSGDPGVDMAMVGEVAANQDAMNALAGDTGGRALRNTNARMAEFVDKILDETANYYLLAWRPDNEEQKRGKFNHIEASVIDRPDLTVRLRSSYFKSAPLPILSTKRKVEKDPTKAREDDMRLVIDAPVAQTQIPTKLQLRVSQMPSVGTAVAATIEINRESLSFDSKEGQQAADVDIGGIFYDDKGKPVNSFVGRLRVFPVPDDTPVEKRKQAIYGFRAWLAPGLYQVRVAVRDVNSGRLGSAMEWVEIPKVR